MNRKRTIHLLLFIHLILVKCDEKEGTNSKKRLPYFRRKVEELEDPNVDLTAEKEDAPNIVSFFVKNVKEIFDDVDENSQIHEKTSFAKDVDKNVRRHKQKYALHVDENAIRRKKTFPLDIDENPEIDKITHASTKISTTVPFTSIKLRKNIYEPPIEPVRRKISKGSMGLQSATVRIFNTPANMSNSLFTTTHKNDMMIDDNIPLTTLLEMQQVNKNNFGIDRRPYDPSLSKDISVYGSRDSLEERDIIRFPSIQPFLNGNTTDTYTEQSDSRRSCIRCDNVVSEDCNDPKNKLIPSVMCERDDDLCYSRHTPFGIIDRGCFNINQNVTTYVCSCNLCNYVSISEMPFMFTKKRDWVDNIIELSRTKHFRNSVFKDMSCLRCEVNTTTKTGDMLDTANCLEGNIGNLPVEDCDPDEICGIRALRADGYIWRGCVKSPLYNYWFALCDQDLCNYDTLVGLYDFVIL